MAKNENLIPNAVSLGLGPGQAAAKMLTGAQLGVGIQPATLDAATPLVFPPTQFVVLQTPRMYNSVPEVGQMLKVLVESHAKSVTGVDFGYTLETAEQPVGHDGQNWQVPTQSKRTPVTPAFVFPEVTGNLVWNIFGQWLKDIQHPDSNASMSRFIDEDLTYMSSAYAMTMLAIQFDPTHASKNIIDTALITNMFPTDPGGLLGLERQIATSKTMERTVTMTGHVQHNDAVRALGQQIATQLQIAKVTYENAVASHSEVESILADTGLAKEVSDLLGSTA